MAELELYGPIREGFAAEIRAQTRGLDREEPIELHISSPGGYAGEGVAAYNVLNALPNPITAFVDGDCFSAATIPLMAADERQLHSNCYLMIHDPAVPPAMQGNISQLEKDLKYLKSVKRQAIEIYQSRVQIGPQKLSHLMREETYLDATTALSDGWVTNVVGPTAELSAKQADEYEFVRDQAKLAELLAKRPVPKDVSKLFTHIEGIKI